MPDLCYLSIAEAARRIAEGSLKPVDLTRAHLKRIEELDSKVRSYITVTPEIALTQAREAGREGVRGRLRGIPISYKDLIATAGIRTTGGSRVYADWVPTKDAHAVARMRRGGAVTLGKATLNEFAFSGTSEQDFVKPARNPWNTAQSPGLSSSGSAAGVAAGLAMASIATDSGGSIRIPASYCGVTGLKPTYGLVGRTGVLALSYSCDHVGILARSAEDAAIVLTSLAGYDPDDPGSRRVAAEDYAARISEPVRGLRVGVCRSYIDAVGLDREVAAAFEAALGVFRSFGARVREAEVPHLAYAPAADFTILRVEGFNIHLKNLREKRQLYGASAFRQIAAGGFLSTVDYYRALQARTLIVSEMNRLFQSVDALATPTTPRTAMPGPITKPSGDRKVSGSGVAFLAPFNLSGHPAVSIPCGFTESGMPIGLQLVGRPFGEATLLRAAYAYQKATDLHRRRPGI
jgi:aspartyl-tRNA(Asn)/glutamyl-tRNA(Gln) amidotransferase subunit A